jgi:L-threonylcarbamoyladenylate synthase
MKTVKLADLEDHRKELAEAIRLGKIFIYPTDTIYGIGCNAERPESVYAIFLAKNRNQDKPFSAIAPSFEWIEKHAFIEKHNLDFIRSLLPGPYTVVLKANRQTPKTIISKEGTVGLRMPKHEFCDFIRSQKLPFITTSINVSGEDPLTDIGEIPESIKDIVDYSVDSGRLEGASSRVFDLTGKEIKILRW